MNKCTITDKLRGPKISNIAIFDTLAVFIFAIIIGFKVMRLDRLIHWIMWFIFWILVGIFVHRLFNIDTMLGYYLQFNKKPIRTECIQ